MLFHRVDTLRPQAIERIDEFLPSIRIDRETTDGGAILGEYSIILRHRHSPGMLRCSDHPLGAREAA
jgi:hypothetical protein